MKAEVVPGAWHFPDWLDIDLQQHIVDEWLKWQTKPGALQRLKLPNGSAMSVQTLCLGWQWVPYRYQPNNIEGQSVAPLPDWLFSLAQRAVTDAFEHNRKYTPDVALVNFYDGQAKLGLHQDKDELTNDPVVSLSVGDACVFRFGNANTRTGPFTDIELRSGDLLIFGGPARFAYHGVLRTLSKSGPPLKGLPTGRLNITTRTTGLPDHACVTYCADLVP